jgi:hypothetical protein
MQSQHNQLLNEDRKRRIIEDLERDTKLQQAMELNQNKKMLHSNKADEMNFFCTTELPDTKYSLCVFMNHC